jgi:serine/threonine-protein kinase
MIGQTLGHYRVLQKLGEGGMGVVYRAHDEQLDREVAIKVLPASGFHDAQARARLLREARSAAALNHPNICTVYEVGEAEGQAYIAMELVPGQPLSAKLAGGSLPPAEVLRYGLQLADALTHAHDHSLIHRDLKSANVMITAEGRAKILDFGLAKRAAGEELAEATTQSELSLTRPGTVVGTLAYMAPEQLRGQPADVRSDVWALGVVLYEMAAGARPFQGKTGVDLSSAILKEPPAPLPTEIRPGLKAVVERCLEKEPDHRYQRAAELRAALEALQTGAVAFGPAWPYSRKKVLLPLGASLLALLVVLLALVGLNVGGLRQRLLTPAAASKIMLAVKPFDNLSGDPEQEALSDGLTEDVSNQLARLQPERLAVIARASAMRYKKTDKPIDQIGRELHVAYVLTGTVRREASRVRITAQLIPVHDQVPLWNETYERNMSGILALQSEVAQRVAQSLALKLLPAERAALTNAKLVNPEAYEACVKGRFHRYKLSRDELNIAEGYFRLALEKDPNYALAYVGIAGVWFSLADAGFLPFPEIVPRWKEAVSKALELDPTLAEAHASLANFEWLYEWDWPAAEREFQRAIQLNPSSAGVHFSYSDFLISMKRNTEWKAEMQRVRELDPLNFAYQCFYGWHLVYLRRYDEAIAQFRQVLASQPDYSSAHMGLWGAFYKKGLDQEALAEAKKFFGVLGDREVVEALDHGRAEAGYRGAMKRAGDTLAARSRRSHVPAIRIARVYAHAGENERALEWLEQAYQRRETTLIHVGVGWDWDGLRSDPRFQDLLRRMNFPK